MIYLFYIFSVLHFVGWAIVLGGYFATIKSPGIYKGVLHGALTALVAGIAMVGIASAASIGVDLDHTKIAVKLVIALVVAALAFVANKKGDQVSGGVKHGIGALTLVNIVVAVFWN